MLKALYAPIYFAKPLAEPMNALRHRLDQYGPVRDAGGGGELVSVVDGSQALVADITGADAEVGAEVMYALHKCRIPVLCLRKRGAPAVRTIETSGHPLLTCREYADLTEASSAIDGFFTPPSSPGRIFVVEGGDGAGKQTQTALLRERLTGMGFPVSTIDFPHDDAMHGTLIRTLLSGAMGDIKTVNPLLFASLYAQNRYDLTPTLSYWLKRGDNVILDRYVEANFGHQANTHSPGPNRQTPRALARAQPRTPRPPQHSQHTRALLHRSLSWLSSAPPTRQASKLPAEERPPLIDALSKFEHDWLGVPRAHRVTYLDLPPSVALAALSADGTRAALDMHETAGADYKNSVRDTYLWCTSNFEHWQRLPCVAPDGMRVSKEKLNDALFESLASEFVNRKVA